MIGHMTTPNMNSTSTCTELGPYGGWDQDPNKLTCVKEYCPLPQPPTDGLWVSWSCIWTFNTVETPNKGRLHF